MLNGLRSRLPLGARADAVELLDEGGLSRREVERNLADLVRLNRLPGGVSASVEGVRRLVARMDAMRIVDVGTGAADVPLRFARAGWHTTAVDLNPEVLAVARRTASKEPSVQVVAGDARHLPFADATFDVAHCSLLVHHLDPDEAVSALSELARVARVGVVVNDLRRGLWPLAATSIATAALARSHVTRRDGLTSARRAYTLAELDELLAAAGLAKRWRSTPWLPRVVTAAARS